MPETTGHEETVCSGRFTPLYASHLAISSIIDWKSINVYSVSWFVLRENLVLEINRSNACLLFIVFQSENILKCVETCLVLYRKITGYRKWRIVYSEFIRDREFPVTDLHSLGAYATLRERARPFPSHRVFSDRVAVVGEWFCWLFSVCT